MARRLARPTRKEKAKSVQRPRRGPGPPGQDAACHRLKKSAGAGYLGHLASAWSANRPPTDIDTRTAARIKAAWAGKAPESLTSGDVLRIITEWEETLSLATAYAYIKGLKRFLRFVDTELSTRLHRLVPRKLQPQPRKRLCPDDEYGRILDASPTWLRIFLELCRSVGLRHGEALTITPSALSAESRRVVLRRKDQGTSDLPLTPELFEAFHFCASQAPDKPVIQTLGGPESHKGVYTAWERAKKKAGADPNLIIHDLRRTAATRVYEQTHDLRTAQQLLGHRSLSSTLLYLAPLNTEKLAEAISAAAPRRHGELLKLKPATEVKQ